MNQPNLTREEMTILNQLLDVHSDEVWDDINSMGYIDPVYSERVAYTESLCTIQCKLGRCLNPN